MKRARSLRIALALTVALGAFAIAPSTARASHSCSIDVRTPSEVFNPSGIVGSALLSCNATGNIVLTVRVQRYYSGLWHTIDSRTISGYGNNISRIVTIACVTGLYRTNASGSLTVAGGHLASASGNSGTRVIYC
jgi:hypothetical protein